MSAENTVRDPRARLGDLVTFLMGPAPCATPRHAYLVLLGFSYLSAFLSLALQVRGLIGSSGLVPAAPYLERVYESRGPEAYALLPTLFWIDSSDAALAGGAWAGVLFSALLILHIWPRMVLFLLWALYGSYLGAGGVFLGYQWDILLAECGLLAMVLAPGGFWPRPGRATAPRRWPLYLHYLLLFRLMFSSGVVKLGSGDETWWSLTAMHFHYYTQPLPTWISWYLHQMPDIFHRGEVAATFVIELGLPFLIFVPGWSRRIAGVGMMFLMGMIALTGNYCFFNLLTAALAVLLLDEGRWPAALLRRTAPVESTAPPSRGGTILSLVIFVTMGAFSLVTLADTVLARNRVLMPEWQSSEGSVVANGPVSRLLRPPLVLARAIWIPLSSLFEPVMRRLHQFHVMGSYGLFASMTTTRDEILYEASGDGKEWYEIRFRYKPGDLARAPPFNAPHQPRLDWQLWFASLDLDGHRGLLESLAAHILKGTPEVLDLIGDPRLAVSPPRYVRLFFDRYEYTTRSEREATGNWWKRTRRGALSGPMSLKPAP